MDPSISRYFSQIGRRGGKKSRRTLDPETAQMMVKIREARRVYRKYHTECFWSFDPDLKVGANDVHWIGQQLLKNGGMKYWKIGTKLCQ